MRIKSFKSLLALSIIVLISSCSGNKQEKLKQEITALEASETTNTPESKLKLAELYEQFATQYPKDSASAGYLAFATQYHYLIGNAQKSVDLGRSYVSLFGDQLSSSIYLNMAKSFGKLNQADSAIQYFEWAQNIDPLENSDLVQLGEMYELASTNPQSPHLEDKLIKAANIRMATGAEEYADSLYQKFITTFPKSKLAPYAYMRRSEIKESNQMIAEAEAILKELIKAYPESEFAKDAQVMIDKKLVGKTDDEKFAIITGGK